MSHEVYTLIIKQFPKIVHFINTHELWWTSFILIPSLVQVVTGQPIYCFLQSLLSLEKNKIKKKACIKLD